MKDKSKRSLNWPMVFVSVCALVICGACAAKKNESVVAFDDFDGKLNLDWQILNADPSHYSLTKKPGTLTITTQKGGFRLSNMSYKNLFLIENPLANGKNFQLTTCLVSFKPSEDYQQAGLVCFNDPDNYIKWVDQCRQTSDRRYFVLIRETQGSVAPHVSVNGIPRAERLWLRITKRGDRYEYSSSADGESYRSHGELPWGDGSPKWIGLVAKNGSNRSAPEIDASFDFFEVRSESIGVKPTPPSAATQEKIDNAAIIVRKAIADKLNKKPDELTTEDYEKTTELDLTGTEVSDLTPLKDLSGLQDLGLENTSVSDLTPLKELKGLQQLYLTDTSVSDLTPLKELKGLQELLLSGTKVSDLTPLKELIGLQSLGLSDTKVSDLTPLKELKNLQSLGLSRTGVSDLTLLKELTGLQGLNLSRTGVSDLTPLKELKKLEWLNLSGTAVSNEQVAELKKALPKLTIIP
jgi:hypothetical protein